MSQFRDHLSKLSMQVMQDLKIYVTVGGKTESGSSVFEDLRINFSHVNLRL
jgi:hypothetical protein